MNLFKRLKRAAWPTALLLATSPTVYSGPTIFPPGGESACEADWITRQPYNSIPSLNQLKRMEAAAERGELGAQLRLGMVYKTLDEKWTTPSDYSYNIQWLQKAIAKGSKSAAAQLATIQYTLIKPRAIDQRTYFKALIAAALEDRNPWVATTLMDLSRGRHDRKWVDAKECMKYNAERDCNGIDLLPSIDTAKYAVIAAEGGNPNAQGWLCLAAQAETGYRAEFGQAQDDKAAFKWCYLAAHQACDSWPKAHLATLYRSGRGVEANDLLADKWRAASGQPWLGNSGLFFGSQK
jgi:TPR repeat protein